MTETPPPVDFVAQANLIHENGPAVTPPSTLYFTFLRTDGESIIAPATNAEMYLRIGYTITGEQTIESLAAWNEENASKEPPAAAPSQSQAAEHAA